jgi:energy-converting hydrogenase Eha subunit E
VFYVATGLWPIVHLRSFEAVTGPKRDRWLVQTVGGLIAAVGTALIAGAFERKSRSLTILGIASAASLGLADLYFAGKRRISPVYLADAAAEAALVAATIAD